MARGADYGYDYLETPDPLPKLRHQRPYGEADDELTAGDFDPSDRTESLGLLDNPLNAFRYTARRFDSGSGSIDMGARRFGPDTGRFLQRDTFQGATADLGLALDPLTNNRYALASGNPISFVEWDGHVVLADGGGGGATSPTPSSDDGNIALGIVEGAGDVLSAPFKMIGHIWTNAGQIPAGVQALAGNPGGSLEAIGAATGFNDPVGNFWGGVQAAHDMSPREQARFFTGIVGSVVGPKIFKAGISRVRNPNLARLPQDIAVNPRPPRPMPLNRPIGASATQNSFLQGRIASLQQSGATDLRVNQNQVNINGMRVGINRPDLQYTLRGARYYEEFETQSFQAALQHGQRIRANEPAGAFVPWYVP